MPACKSRSVCLSGWEWYHLPLKYECQSSQQEYCWTIFLVLRTLYKSTTGNHPKAQGVRRDIKHWFLASSIFWYEHYRRRVKVHRAEFEFIGTVIRYCRPHSTAKKFNNVGWEVTKFYSACVTFGCLVKRNRPTTMWRSLKWGWTILNIEHRILHPTSWMLPTVVGKVMSSV